jgi:hypothetical protein
MAAHPTPDASPLALLDLTSGHRTTAVAARLGVADLLADGPKSSAELAADVNASVPRVALATSTFCLTNPVPRLIMPLI